MENKNLNKITELIEEVKKSNEPMENNDIYSLYYRILKHYENDKTIDDIKFNIIKEAYPNIGYTEFLALLQMAIDLGCIDIGNVGIDDNCYNDEYALYVYESEFYDFKFTYFPECVAFYYIKKELSTFPHFIMHIEKPDSEKYENIIFIDSSGIKIQKCNMNNIDNFRNLISFMTNSFKSDVKENLKRLIDKKLNSFGV